jgi:hypothetical protein
MTTDLYRNERFKFGSKASEDAEFADHVARVLAVQERLAREHFAGERKRVFHAKMHACLLGTLTLRPDRPAATRHGIFGDDVKQRYNVLARFSNGVGIEQHDLKPDVRGIALKIFGVAAATSGDVRCIDWLLTNSTNPFGRDQEEFVEFMEANAGSPLELAAYLAAHPTVFALLLKATARVVPSLATERYWSGHPYLLGSDMAMKFNLAPAPGASAASSPDSDDHHAEARRIDSLARRALDEAGAVEERIARWFALHAPEASPLHADYLRRDLLRRLAAAPLRFTLSVQLEKSPAATPIEDTLVEWKETDSQSLPVADLELDRQSVEIDNEGLRFTPAHFVAAHRPLGNLARGRLFTYNASQDGRRAAAADPAEGILFHS